MIWKGKQGPRAGGRSQGHGWTQETALQYLTVCESKRSKRDQARERSRCEGGGGRS